MTSERTIVGLTMSAPPIAILVIARNGETHLTTASDQDNREAQLALAERMREAALTIELEAKL